MGWKHMPMEWAPSHTIDPKSKRINIVMARHPLTWMLSNIKTAYSYNCDYQTSLIEANRTLQYKRSEDMYEDTPKWWKDLEWKDFTSCKFTIPFNCIDYDAPNICDQVDDPNHPIIHFNNLIEIWNLYYKGYLASEVPTIIIRYEDVLVDPEHIMGMLSEAISKPLGSFKMVTSPAKETYSNNKNARHSARNFDDAVRFNLGKDYMHYFNDDIIEHVKSAIDQNVLATLGYSL